MTQRTTTRNDGVETPTLAPMETRKPAHVACRPSVIPAMATSKARADGKSLGEYLENLVLKDTGKRHSLAGAAFDEAGPLSRAGNLLARAIAALDTGNVGEARRLLVLVGDVQFEMMKALQEPLIAEPHQRSQVRFEESGGQGTVAAEYRDREDYDAVPNDGL
jgi:hypothetical protein